MRAYLMPMMILGAAGLLIAADAPDPSPAQIDDIIQKFAAKESEFAKARESYTYHQTARIQELDPSGNVEGQWETVSDIVFDAAGHQGEHGRLWRGRR